jgi:diguanylate cyclase (GGDEF)-like protein/PAS domain S-box-containing protein
MEMNYNDLITRLFEGVYIVDSSRKILFWNSGSEAITGYQQEEVVNKHCFDNILDHVDENGVNLCKNGCPLHKTLETGEILENNVFLRHKNGYRVPISIRTMPLYDQDGNIVAAIEVFHDNRMHGDVMTENRRLQLLLIKDELTGAYNRRYTSHQIQALINEYNTFQTPFAVLFIDIDHFKQINDVYGHNIGDDVLRTVSTTIQHTIRQDDFLGRWGGEEFIVVLKHVQHKDLILIAEKIRLLVEKSTTRATNDEIHVTISIGGTSYQDGYTIDQLIEEADHAMYQAKQQGRNRSIITDIKE